MFRRRNTRKPAEDLYSTFKQQYSHLNDPTLDALPASPFPPGPPLPAAAISQADSEPAQLPQELDKKAATMSPQSYELPELESFNPPGHFLDPNHLDTTIGGGFAPSQDVGFHSSSSNMVFSSSSALDLSAAHHFDPSAISAVTSHGFFPFQPSLAAEQAAASSFDLGSAMSNYQHFAHPPPHTAFGNEPNFDPQQSLIHASAHSALLSGPQYSNLQNYTFAPHAPQMIKQQTPAPLSSAQKQQQQFRWHLTLRAHTAMIKSEEEIPMTYLNKRQPYTVFLKDTKSRTLPAGPMVQYRTCLRVCFDEEQQRSRPAACWQLFREGRGNQENDARGGGTLQAVEYVHPEQSALSGLGGNVVLEKEDFDGFSFTWWPTSTGAADCSVQLRFNFLSTDFSHSKGVKGVPVRLVAKTEIIGTADQNSSDMERSYCKIKLFRDHGAERKLANDRQHLSKKIEKLQKQLGEDEFKDNGKRRRSDSIARPAKVMKHSRTWSVSSEGSDFDNQADGELQSQLRSMEAQFATQQDYSLFFLRGEDADDGDLYPIDLSDQPAPVPPLAHTTTQGTTHSSNQSPTSSTLSVPPNSRQDSSGFRMPTPITASTPRQGSVQDTTPSSRPSSTHHIQHSSNPQHLVTPPEGVHKVQKQHDGGAGASLDWIEAMDVDTGYKAPIPRRDKAIACIYIKPTIQGMQLGDDYYRAIYLHARTRQELVNRIGSRCGVNPSSIEHVVRIRNDGLHIAVDDDFVLEIAEGQDMHAFLELASDESLGFDNDDQEAGRNRYYLTLRY